MILAIDSLGKVCKERGYYEKEEILDVMNALRLELWIIDNELERRDEMRERLMKINPYKKLPKLEEEEETEEETPKPSKDETVYSYVIEKENKEGKKSKGGVAK